MTGRAGGPSPGDGSGEGLTRDLFLGGRLALWQPRQGYRAAVDPVLLAAFAPAAAGHRVLDLGCGVGTAGFCLAARVPGVALSGLELQPAYAALARRNSVETGIAMAVHEGDLRRPPPALRAGPGFDLVHPPYLAPGAGTAAQDEGRDRALREGEAGLGDWIGAGLRRLRPGGWLALVHRAERLGAILAALEGAAGASEILPLAPRQGRPATRVLVRARKGARAALRLLPPVALHVGAAHDGDRDSYGPEVAAALRDAAPLGPPPLGRGVRRAAGRSHADK